MAKAKNTDKKTAPLPKIQFPHLSYDADYATILGVVFAVGLIFAAILLGQSSANFFNVPALMIVLLGTIAATAISFTTEELNKAGNVIGNSLIRKVFSPGDLAVTLLDLSSVARKRGILSLVNYERQMVKGSFMSRAMQMVVDGMAPEKIEGLLSNEIELMAERHMRSATITRRAAEVAPAMGLIGTLVGLVQMLADLESPETIGPAMAVALLTTFYGAILGTIIMAPLAIKLEKNSTDEILVYKLIALTAVAIARQDNPRHIEMLLNSELPPSERVAYFD